VYIAAKCTGPSGQFPAGGRWRWTENALLREHRELTSASHFAALFPPDFVECAPRARPLCSRFALQNEKERERERERERESFQSDRFNYRDSPPSVIARACRRASFLPNALLVINDTVCCSPNRSEWGHRLRGTIFEAAVIDVDCPIKTPFSEQHAATRYNSLLSRR
jgi:hypothetical protein